MTFIEGFIPDFKFRNFYPARISVDSGKIIKIEELKSCSNRFILPGLIDAHVHIESSMLLPSEFGKRAAQFGTVAVLADPHELANVLGISGIEGIILEAKNAPIKIFFGAPSCVPATPFETNGSELSASDIHKLFEDRKCHFLGEVMNVPGVLGKDPILLEKISHAKNFGFPIDGHAPGLTGSSLKSYVQTGIFTDHECTSVTEAIEKINLGMKVIIRNGSAAKNLETLISLIKEFPDKLMFCTDDCHPDDLVKGHINVFVKYGLENGFSIFDLLQVASINPVLHYNLPVGILRIGDPADFIVLDELEKFEIKETWINGTRIVPQSNTIKNNSATIHPNKFYRNPISTTDLEIENTTGKIRVIEVLDGSLYTRQREWNVTGEKFSIIQTSIKEDILKLVVLNRYYQAKPAVAFVHGFKLREGAFASTVAHDSHNILAVGVKDEDIVNAIQQVQDYKGGLAVVSAGNRSILKLPFAGLMTDLGAEETAVSYKLLSDIVKSWGCKLNSPFMTLSFLALLVIPELKLSDKGLFDGKSFSFVPNQLL